MKNNVGSTDKGIRILLAIIFAVLIITGEVSGVLAIILGIVAVALVLTSVFSFCPLYAILKTSTLKKSGKA
jgi:predicted lysophospholipase L1 biosynthesis ABC-type transport system permease subunit